MTIEQAKEICTKYGWSSKLGYSKRELGIKTPKNRCHKDAKRREARNMSHGVSKYFFKLFRRLTNKNKK